MNENLQSIKQVERLKNKLESALSTQSVLEADMKTQTTLLIRFIGKLSQVCKGIDLELDNKLANFRSLITQTNSFDEIEQHIESISELLKQHSKINDIHLNDLHQQITSSGKALDKTQGISTGIKRDLKVFLTENAQSKDAVIQYVPLLTKLIEFYDSALRSKTGIPKGGLLGNVKSATKKVTEPEEHSIELKLLIKNIIVIIDQIELSNALNRKLSNIKVTLDENLALDVLMEKFADIFNLIILDFKQERETAKSFLSTLSETLSVVQSAVKNTICTNEESKEKHAILNNQLNKQIMDVTNDVKKATNLEHIKNEINDKLHKIADTLSLKAAFERKQQNLVEQQLISMKERVQELEEQGETFKKRVEDQKIKSLQDPLTKLSNRGAFDDFFAKQMVRFHHKPFELSIVVLDLDDFKRINDTYGHTAGDKTLQVIASTLSKKVGDEAFIARYGGEEFVLIYSTLDSAQLMAKLNALKSHIAKLPFKFKNNKVSITSSIGATHIKAKDNVHIAFERADAALYEAKAQGKNQVVYAE